MMEIEKGHTAEKAPKAVQYVSSLLAASASWGPLRIHVGERFKFPDSTN